MADRKLYYEDATLERIETEVVEAGELDGRPWVRLEATVFYPEGGGQPADRGTVGGVEVVGVQSRGPEVLHFLARPLGVGPVVILLDGVRRLDLRQQHSAQHLLTAILADRHDRATTSFHLGEEYAAIEVDGSVPSPDRLHGIEEEVNRTIRQDLPVHCRFVDPAQIESLRVRTRGLPDGHLGPVRIVEIEGLDRNTCGGTHVSRLSEIQMVRVLDAAPARGGARIRFLAGNRVLHELRRLSSLENALRARIGTGSDEFVSVLNGWMAERKRLDKRVGDLERSAAESIAREVAASEGSFLFRTVPGAGPDMLRAIALAVLSRRPEATVGLVGETGEPLESCFVVQAGPDGPPDVSAWAERLRDRLSARGGGRGRFFQGRGGKSNPAEALRDILPPDGGASPVSGH